jgi:DNA-binding NarL/FixJ family response regulator
VGVNEIRVAIIEDGPDVREGLAVLIADSPAFVCCGVWASMEEALEQIEGAAADVVLADIGLPGMSGIEGTRRLRSLLPNLPVLVLTVHNDDERIFAAMCAGACGYLLKNTHPDKLLEHLREVASGGAVMTPSVARRVVELFRQFRPPENQQYRLSPPGNAPAEIAGRGASLQNRGGGTGDQPSHGEFPFEIHLRKAAGPFEVGGGGEGPPRGLDYLKRRASLHPLVYAAFAP